MNGTSDFGGVHTECSRGDEIYRIALDDIVIDDDIQPREKLNKEHIKKMKNKYRNGQEMEPLVVARYNDGVILIDGFHRYYALKKLKEEYVDVVVLEHLKTFQEMKEKAFSLNEEHGLNLRKKELREHCRQFMESNQWKVGRWGNLSLGEIASQIGGSVSKMTVWRWIKEDFPEIHEEYYKNKKELDESFSLKNKKNKKGFKWVKPTAEEADEALQEKIRKKASEALRKVKGLVTTLDVVEQRRFMKENEGIFREILSGERQLLKLLTKEEWEDSCDF